MLISLSSVVDREAKNNAVVDLDIPTCMRVILFVVCFVYIFTNSVHYD